MNLISLVNLLFTLIYLAILGRIILTLVLSFMRNDSPLILVSVTQVLIQVTEPLLVPIRRLLPTFGSLDFSPLVAIILLQIIQALIKRAL